MNVHYRNKEVYPQINKPCRCIDTYNRKASVALWVHPFTQIARPVCEARCMNVARYIHTLTTIGALDRGSPMSPA